MQVFCRFNKWNKTGLRRLDFIYHMAKITLEFVIALLNMLKTICIAILCMFYASTFAGNEGSYLKTKPID